MSYYGPTVMVCVTVWENHRNWETSFLVISTGILFVTKKEIKVIVEGK
jgi:F0F1-type ATP synthase epsilon subunit